MATTGIAHRQGEFTLRPIAWLKRGQERAGVAKLLGRITDIIDNGNAPAYLFVYPDGAAYLLHDCQGATPHWLRERWTYYVACYARRTIPGMPTMMPDEDGILEDVIEHLSSLGD